MQVPFFSFLFIYARRQLIDISAKAPICLIALLNDYPDAIL